MKLDFASTGWLGKWCRSISLILIPATLGPVIGLSLSYAFSTKYTSYSSILVERHQSDQAAQPVVSEGLAQTVLELQEVLGPSRLKPMVERMGLAVAGKTVEQEADEISRHARITPAPRSVSHNETAAEENSNEGSDVATFYVEYTGPTPGEAQKICNGLTFLLLEENLNSRPQETEFSAEFLQEIDEAKRNLDEQNTKLADFKEQHSGQLGLDIERNTSALMGLNAQLNETSQRISQAQQNKLHAESLLDQKQTEMPKSAQSSLNRALLEKQLSDLRSQLMQGQAQYADDNPDVVKTKVEIANVQKRLADDSDANVSAEEALELSQLRSQAQQYDEAIGEIKREQERIKQQIKVRRQRTVSNPSVENEYKQLIGDRDRAQEMYTSLLASKEAIQNATDVIPPPTTEVRRMLYPANLPGAPSFPNRLLFAATGWLGLALGLRFICWFEVRQRRLPSKASDQAYGQIENPTSKVASAKSPDF